MTEHCGLLRTQLTEEFYDFVIRNILPKMSLYPGPQSVMILDNCNIHKSEALPEAVEAFEAVLLFLPAYSPDFNPIEKSFSASIKELPLVLFLRAPEQ
ncbi:transposase [Moniliophthora roreri MCA 2997]|uniref:Transposase n=1 Tax=Moniliophthora roreri (strain MCA 2997) TaxID=1381753 RepID=V2WW61_MONRO|nr:transposase [Moniliophthora roreri MCA 2997]